MINLSTDDARVEQYPKCWLVLHPYNDAILATCDTEEEAIMVREAFNDLARQLRGIGHKVTP